jgi:D-serine deaminase-like pyridoxal phosphate-dependent protein
MNPFSATDVYETLSHEVEHGVLSMEDLVQVGVGFARLTVQGIDVKGVMLALIQAYPQHTILIYESFGRSCTEEEVLRALTARWPSLFALELGQSIMRDLIELRTK